MKNNNKITKQTIIFSLLILSAINSIKCQVVIQNWVTLASDASPKAIAIDASKNVYVANNNFTVSKITAAGVYIPDWAILASGAYPRSITIDTLGNVYVANSNNTISKITEAGVCTQNWVVLASDASVGGIAIDASGNIYTANGGNNTVSKISPAGICTQNWATLASGAYPSAITIDTSGNVYTINFSNSTVSKISADGVCSQNWVTLTSGSYPGSIAIDAYGNIYTASRNKSIVSKITPAGICTENWATLASGSGPYKIAVDSYNNIYTLNIDTRTVSKITSLGVCTKSWATLASGTSPTGIAIDSSGNVYTANQGNSTVSLITSSPTISTYKLPLSGFTYPGTGPSAIQSFTVNGYLLTDAVTVTPPANYEISLSSGINFNASASITLTPINGVLVSNTIYVRLKSGLASGSYNESITLTSYGAVAQNISLSGTLNAPTITPGTSTLTGFTYSDNGPSAEKSFTMSGTRLSEGVVLTAPDNYEMSIFTGTNFVALPSMTLDPTNGELASTTIYVRLKAGLAAGSYNESINLTSTGAVTKNISLSGTLNAPTITPNISSLTGFTYSGNGPSAEKSFKVSGTRLLEGVVLTAPYNYEMSIFTGANFIALPTITLAPTNGVLASNTIYVRLKAGIASGTYNESLSLTTLGGENKIVALNGTVTNPAIVTSVNQIFGLNYTANGPSTDQFFSVSGLYLSSSVLITSPTNFEISLGSGALFTSASPVILSISAGTLANKNIYTRLKSGLANGTYTGNIQLISTGAPTQNIALTGIVGPTALPNVSEDGCKVYGVGKNIIVENAIMGSSFAVYNIYGAEIISGKLSSNIIELDSAMPVGVYFIKLNNKIAKVIL